MPEITKSTAKLRRWHEMQQIDVRAQSLFLGGMDRTEAYRQAFQEHDEGTLDTPLPSSKVFRAKIEV